LGIPAQASSNADLWKQMGMKALLNKAGFIQTLPAMESEREGW
jgi:hypothetical protein